LFGPDLDSGIAGSSDPALGKCQSRTLTAASQCHLARLKEFRKCVKKDLAGKEGLTIVDLAGFEACLGRDSKGKVAKVCDATTGKVRQALDKRCSAVDLSVALAGCGTADVTATASCIDTASRCIACLATDIVHDMTVDCDLEDDGLANASCLIPGP
jgi:hypothetical protein